MRKTVVILILFAGIAGFLYANGSSESAAATHAPSPATGSSSAPVTISFLHIFGGGQGKVVDSLVQKFNASQSSVVVKASRVPGWYSGLLEKLQVLAAADQLPATALAGFSYTSFMNNSMPVVPVSGLIGSDTFSTSDYFPKMLALGQNRDGSQIALPFAVSSPVIYANLDAFKAAGIPATEQPKSWQEIRSWAKRLTNGSRKGIFFQMDFDTWMFQTLLDSSGGRFASVKEKKVLINSAKGLAVLNYWLDMMNNDRSMPYMTGSQAAQSFEAGNLGMLVATSGNLGELEKSVPFKLGVMMLPSSGPTGYARRLPAGGSAIYIMKTSRSRERAAWKFVRFATSIEGSAIIAKGMGYMTTHKSAIEPGGALAGYLKSDPLAAVVYKQRADIENWFNWPGTSGPKITKLMLDQFQAAFTHQKSAQQALDTAATGAARILGWN